MPERKAGPLTVSEAYKEFESVHSEIVHGTRNGKKPSKKTNKRFWNSVCNVLHAYRREENLGYSDNPIHPFPPTVAIALERVLGEMVAGTLPEPWEALRRAGAPSPLPLEREDIGWAVRYMKASREGVISDKSPNKTVREAYGVGESTVRSWVKKYPHVKTDDFLPNASPKVRAAIITKRVKSGGTRYSHSGRSLSAISTR
jgi:hypothetical protein